MNEYTEVLITRFYDNLEEILLACMAAGVPANQMWYEEPKVVWEDYITKLVSRVHFKECLK